MIPFSLLSGGFAIFWEYLALSTTSKTPGLMAVVFPLWGLPFVAVGVYIIFGRFLVEQPSVAPERPTAAEPNRHPDPTPAFAMTPVGRESRHSRRRLQRVALSDMAVDKVSPRSAPWTVKWPILRPGRGSGFP